MLALVLACTAAPEPGPSGPLDDATLAKLDWRRMQEHVQVLASDGLGGRIPGSPGSRQARDYLVGELQEMGVQPLGEDGGYVFTYPSEPVQGRFMLDEAGAVVPQANAEGLGHDIVGLIPGSDPALADEYMVLVAHYDHLGVDSQGRVYNGAYDDAAAVAMSLELARLLVEAPPGRSVVLLLSDDEESGLWGSRAWIEAAHASEEDIVLAISADPLGRPVLPDFCPIVILGLERSPALLAAWRETTAWSEAPVVFVHRDLVELFYSDNDSFMAAEPPTPAAWVTNPGMVWYHTVDDDAETIDYKVLRSDARHLAQVLTVLGGTPERYAYEGAPPLDGAAARDIRPLFEGVLASAYPNSIERSDAQDYLAQLDRVIAADTLEVLDSPDAFALGAMIFLMVELPTKYPGPIPPTPPER